MVSAFIRRALAASIIFVTACADASDPSEAGTSIETSDSVGMRVVQIGDFNSLQLPEWNTRTIYSTASTHQSLELGEVAGAAFLPDSVLVVADRQRSELIFLAPDGGAHHRIGREGEGPGEFELISRVGGDAAGNVFVFDQALLRTTVLDAVGNPHMIQSIDLNGRFRPFLPLNRSAKDGYVAIFEDFVDVPAGMHRQPVFLVVTDSLGQMTDTLGRWPGKEFQAIDGGDDWMPVGFARTTLYAGSHGRSVLATTDSVDITLYSGQDRVLGIRGGRLPAETNDEDRQVWLDRYLGRFQGSAREMWRSRIDQSTIRETHPAFGALAIDDAGRIWLGDYADVHDNERTWTILSRHGRPIAQLQLPVYRPETIEVENTVRGYPTHELLSIIGDRIALLGRDELDVQYINVVQLVRKDVP